MAISIKQTTVQSKPTPASGPTDARGVVYGEPLQEEIDEGVGRSRVERDR